MPEPFYDEKPEWLKQAEAADRYNLKESMRLPDSGWAHRREFSEEEHRAHLAWVRAQSEARAREQIRARSEVAK